MRGLILTGLIDLCRRLMALAQRISPTDYAEGERIACENATREHQDRQTPVPDPQPNHCTAPCMVPGCRQTGTHSVGISPLCELHWQCLPASVRQPALPGGGRAWLKRYLVAVQHLMKQANHAAHN